MDDLCFVMLESFFDIILAMHHQSPEQFAQLARQSDIGRQPANASAQAPVESAQGFIHAARDD